MKKLSQKQMRAQIYNESRRNCKCILALLDRMEWRLNSLGGCDEILFNVIDSAREPLELLKDDLKAAYYK